MTVLPSSQPEHIGLFCASSTLLRDGVAANPIRRIYVVGGR
jgi:hypothetical protein